MSAPEHIYVDFKNRSGPDAEVYIGGAVGRLPKYTRADLYTAAQAEIARLREELATARDRALEEAAEVASECQQQNGPLSKKGFNEHYRAGLEAGAQAIAAAIRTMKGAKP